jgi:hypothetical protein
MRTLTIDQAGERLGVDRGAVVGLIEGRRVAVLYAPTARIPVVEVDRLLRERAARERRAAIGEQRALSHLSVEVEELGAWLLSMRARGAESEGLAGLEERLALKRDALARRRAASSRPSSSLPAGRGYLSRSAAAAGRTSSGRFPPQLVWALMSAARTAHARGVAYLTHVHGQRVSVHPGGEIVGENVAGGV